MAHPGLLGPRAVGEGKDQLLVPLGWRLPARTPTRGGRHPRSGLIKQQWQVELTQGITGREASAAVPA